MANIARHRGFTVKPNLIPEFERVIDEARPHWFVMENVDEAPEPVVADYRIESLALNPRWLGDKQNRRRRFSFGTRDGRRLDVSEDLCLFENPSWAPAVMAGSGRAINVKVGGSGKVKATWKVQREPRALAECAELQGLPANFLEDAPFTQAGKQRVIGNGVPLPMGRAIARAVKRAMEAVQ